MKPSLYGIKNSNRNFADPFYWGKNQFNSSFPVALACYMRDNKIPAVYIRHGKKSNTYIDEIGFEDVFNTKHKNETLFFAFEKRYQPFECFVEDELKSIDLVIMDNATQAFLRPVEIKLTTLPDDGTSDGEELDYGSEIVVRSPTMRYMAMSMAKSCSGELKCIREIFDPVCNKIRDWNNLHEVLKWREKIMLALELFLNQYASQEQPLLMQPVWKTEGKSPVLANNCLDIFVWSDFALSRLFMNASRDVEEKISRPQRSALRLARFLYELSYGGKVFQQPIYDGMTYDTLNDKEFAVSGRKTNPFMRCPRLLKPIVTKDEIKNLILGGGQKYLSPERRFDAILYFSKDLF